MKILSVSYILSDSAAAQRILNIVRLLHEKGVDIEFVQYAFGNNPKKQFGKNLKLPFPSRIVYCSPLTVFFKHLNELSKQRYDVVYGNGHAAVLFAALGRFKGVPLVADLHGGITEEFRFNHLGKAWWFSPKLLVEYGYKKVMDVVALRWSDMIVCVSETMSEYLQTKRRVPKRKITVATNGIDLRAFQPTLEGGAVKESLGLSGKTVFGYVGNMQSWQGVGNFLAAAKKMEDAKTAAFLLVGAEQQQQTGNITFLPKIARERLPDYYAACDALVLPRPDALATRIAAPTKFAEYAAAGKPIITTAIGDATALVKQYQCGLVVADNAPETLARGMELFLNTSLNEREIMGKNARLMAEKEFDWNVVMATLLKSLEALAARKA